MRGLILMKREKKTVKPEGEMPQKPIKLSDLFAYWLPKKPKEQSCPITKVRANKDL